MMRLFDTHCHLDFPAFLDNQALLRDKERSCDADLLCVNKVYQQAKENGVDKLLIPSIGQNNWDKVAKISTANSSIYHSLGLHPYFLEDHEPNALSALSEQLRNRHSRCVAIGECGLDFAIEALNTPKNRAKQLELFEAQLVLANQFELPVIIHSRKAHPQILALLKKHRPKKGGVIHAFSGSYQQAMAFIELGFYIGIGGVITYERAHKTRQAIQALPVEFLVLETDAPDMPINGHQGEANHPKYTLEIFESLAMLKKDINRLQLAHDLWQNSHRLFQVDKS